MVVTFHSREQEEWSVKEGSREEVQSYFEGICSKARQQIDLPKDWKRWATADREPIGQWTFGRATLLGDAALVRNELWKGRSPERFYDAMEWLYGWNVENCLAA